MNVEPGQVWYWPKTDELILILDVMIYTRRLDKEEIPGYDTLDLTTGFVSRCSPRSIDYDPRWERMI